MSKAVATKPARRPKLAVFLSEVRAELRKVKWPNRHELWQLTGVVFTTVFAIGLYVALLDFLFTKIFQAIGMFG